MPIDDAEREQLLRELLAERFGPPPRRPAADNPPRPAADDPRLVAHRRRVLCGLDEQRRAA